MLRRVGGFHDFLTSIGTCTCTVFSAALSTINRLVCELVSQLVSQLISPLVSQCVTVGQKKHSTFL